ncbi:MAG TPA: DUF1778 domain-containing protein [Caulobacteraceae bacterium]
MPAANRAARFEARITPEVQRQLKRAAELEGRSLSDFVVSAAVEAAQRTIERTETILVTLDEHDRLWDAIRNPPEPTQALRDAFKAHRELIAE